MKQYPEDTAREAIEQQADGISKEVIFHITLAGGGPAARFKVTVDGGRGGKRHTAILRLVRGLDGRAEPR